MSPERALYTSAQRETKDWAESQLNGLAGLPEGWHACAERLLPDPATPTRTVDLIRRDAGGWIILHCYTTEQREDPIVVGTATTLVALNRSIIDNTNTSFGTQVRTWLRESILSLYDPSVEADAIARVLVALGAEIDVEPSVTTLQTIRG